MNPVLSHLWVGLGDKVKFIDCDTHLYTCRIKEAVHIRLHPNNINRENRIETPEACRYARSNNTTAKPSATV